MEKPLVKNKPEEVIVSEQAASLSQAELGLPIEHSRLGSAQNPTEEKVVHFVRHCLIFCGTHYMETLARSHPCPIDLHGLFFSSHSKIVFYGEI